MTESSLLRQILEANKSFLAGSPRFLDPAGDPFVIITCIDPRLTGFLEPALGVPRHRGVIIRSAGNMLSERTRDELRSIAVALFVKKAREILVVGHTDCGMYGFSVPEVTEAFRKAGIPREAFGQEDLRTWFGAFPNIRENVVGSTTFLRGSGIVPNDVKIHGLVFETERGAVEVVVDGGLIQESILPAPAPSDPKNAAVAAAPTEIKPEPIPVPASIPPPPPAPPRDSTPKKGPVIVGPPAAKSEPAVTQPRSLLDAALILREVFTKERQSAPIQKAIADLKAIWREDKNPYRIIAELQRLARDYETKYPKLPGALLYLENAVRSGHSDKIGFGEILKRIFD
jgi:carbonic anhydrase